jgi:hypothetical protein
MSETKDRTPPSAAMPDPFDRLLGSLHGLPDVAHTRLSTVRVITPLLGNSETFIVQTYRQAEQGDTIFLERSNRDGNLRIAIPAKVADLIARQRDALTAKSRSRAARRVAQDRLDRGEAPAFLRKPKAAP